MSLNYNLEVGDINLKFIRQIVTKRESKNLIKKNSAQSVV